MKLNVYPGKLAIRKKEVKLKGSILLPPNRAKLYEIGEVVAVGDLTAYGPERKLSTKETYKPGDLVLFQLPEAYVARAAVMLKGVLHAFIHIDNIIGRLANDTISVENFNIVGRFILLNAEVRQQGIILIPDNASEAKNESIHFSVLQTGKDVREEYGLRKGLEVFPDKGRVNPISIDGKEFCFVDQSDLHGSLSLE